jgi:hypothetical protein
MVLTTIEGDDDENQRERVKLKVENTIRWRFDPSETQRTNVSSR